MTTVRLRAEGPADAVAIRQLVAEAFASPDTRLPAEVRLVEALRVTDAWLPELSMVAEVDGELVGYALLSRVEVWPGGVPALALGPVAVRPGRQRRGYGQDVVRAALDAAAELGERLVVVLGNPAYYRRFGFSPAARFGLTSPWSGLGDPWQALMLPSEDGSDDPVPSGEVTFPPPWSQV
ncbi:GNAT family N-acetyltransferase [Plantactinospora sp. CA-294935]|uniref:GNAT family N-acetyltransferase n=1 Tax=Plantactinospora sp. CA-294935 TaxID=3240012 RepID=UPI003D93D404